jgi:fructan beta-fructosidase
MGKPTLTSFIQVNHSIRSIFPAALAVMLTTCPVLPAADDLLLADFEGTTYGGWTATGAAFGPGPAQGTLPGQMTVSGYEGKGLASSFHGGDDSTGTLVSPEFMIGRKYLRYLIGGGGWAGKTCLNLLVDGQIVRTATGANLKAGGSEALEATFWDLSDLQGKSARLEMVDEAKGGWAHLSVDHLVQTDTKPAVMIQNPSRELKIEKRYLHFPVKNGAPNHRVAVLVKGQVVREFEIALSDQPEWWAHLDAGTWVGETATLRVDRQPSDAKALGSITQADTIHAADSLYREPLRPLVHFSARRGWLNDPNGMVFSQGEYHLFFQHNPYGWSWGNMHWGHAVSRDMVHWEELPIALYPPEYDDMAFSGSAVIDSDNTSGWKTGTNDLLVAAFTSTGRGECIVHSNDRGRTWQEFEGNPVIKHQGRDPRLLWHAPTRQWVMTVYTEDRPGAGREKIQDIAFYTSPDLKKWTYQSRIPGFFECPDFFELPVDGDAKNTRWVLSGASSEYRVGRFDGKTFLPETAMLPDQRGKDFYAAQTFSNIPDKDGRRIQIGWLRAAAPGMSFNQCMSLPQELRLISTADGPRLSRHPVNELLTLRQPGRPLANLTLKPGDANPLAEITGEALEVRAEFQPKPGSVVNFELRGIKVRYDTDRAEITVNGHTAPAPLRGGIQRIVIYLDRTAIEVFASDGLTYVPMPLIPEPDRRGVMAGVEGESVTFTKLEGYTLGSIWK